LTTVGVISDTHKLLRPEALVALRGVDHIVHAGDVGAAYVLEALRELAPLHAVKGNIDRDAWAGNLPDTMDIEIDGVRIHVTHDLKTTTARHLKASDVVIAGHSHQPLIEHRGNTLILNPGSAGPRRFTLPVALGLLHLDSTEQRAEILHLPIPPRGKRSACANRGS
tara:strand:+ start:194 stop:694 length:501 start_codon:yes stop_codon:yes gene_type:complete